MNKFPLLRNMLAGVYALCFVACCFFYLLFPYVSQAADETVTTVFVTNGVTEDDPQPTYIGGRGDTTRPVIISVVLADITTSSASIAWETNELTLGTFRYGYTTSYELGAVAEEKYARSHIVSLSGLKPDQKYFFQITTFDPARNFSETSQSFLLGPPTELREPTQQAQPVEQELSELSEEFQTDDGTPKRSETENVSGEETQMPDEDLIPEQEIVPDDVIGPTEVGSDEPRETSESPEARPAPLVQIEDFEQTFGVEHVNEIPQERREGLTIPDMLPEFSMVDSVTPRRQNIFRRFVERLDGTIQVVSRGLNLSQTVLRRLPAPRIASGVVFSPETPITVFISFVSIIGSLFINLFF